MAARFSFLCDIEKNGTERNKFDVKYDMNFYFFTKARI